MNLLSERLRIIADMINDPSLIVADVGCDHGYLSIVLVDEKRVGKAIAMDLRPGPLAHARENISRFGLDGQIETRISDGLKALQPGEANYMVIAGMGGPLMVRILEQSPDQVACLSGMILEPQSEPETLREYLCHKEFPGGKFFSIREEAFVREEGKYYPVIRYVAGENAEEQSQAETLYGPCLLRDRPLLLMEYMKKRKSQLQGLMIRLQKNGQSQQVAVRIAELQKELEIIDSVERLSE